MNILINILAFWGASSLAFLVWVYWIVSREDREYKKLWDKFYKEQREKYPKPSGGYNCRCATAVTDTSCRKHDDSQKALYQWWAGRDVLETVQSRDGSVMRVCEKKPSLQHRRKPTRKKKRGKK